MRQPLDRDPFFKPDGTRHDGNHGAWPACWVSHPDASRAAAENHPFVAAYRLRFTLDRPRSIACHVTADERYELYLDGQSLGRGPERGDPFNWFFETYRLELPAGPHVLLARVWTQSPMTPMAQMSVRHGFLLAAAEPDLPLVSTGHAAWESLTLEGYRFVPDRLAWGRGANLVIDAAAQRPDLTRGDPDGDGWQPALKLHRGANSQQWNNGDGTHRLRPAMLPEMIDRPWSAGVVRHVGPAPDEPPTEHARATLVDPATHDPVAADDWQRWLGHRQPLTIPPRSAVRCIIDLTDYLCAYPTLRLSLGPPTASTHGRESVRLRWAEALFTEPEYFHCRKGDRHAVDGKYFYGVGDTFLPDPARVGRPQSFTPLWWQAGRFLELVVRTADRPLTLHALELRETRYPLEYESRFACDGATDGRGWGSRLESLVPLLVRGVQMCAHETYFDCPYYEQLMYAGDTRTEVLTTYCMSRDSRLPAKAVEMFGLSRLIGGAAGGLTQSRYPSRRTQIIPPFSLWWVCMVHDLWMWRDEPETVRRNLPGVRTVLDAFLSYRNGDGLVEGPPGWNFVDWVPNWKRGVPPDGETGVSGPINWQLVLALSAAAELERGHDEPEMAKRWDRQAKALVKRITEKLWDPARSLFADDLARGAFSEHSQALAILSGYLPDARRRRVARALIDDQPPRELGTLPLERATIYFSHYVLEALTRLGRTDRLLHRLRSWFELTDMGFKTPIERPDPSRSDCHAWGSHPLYHLYASLLGIRPGGPGFSRVLVRPGLGPIQHATAKLVHPRGWIDVQMQQDPRRLIGHVTLPDGITGSLEYQHQTLDLAPGHNPIDLTPASE